MDEQKVDELKMTRKTATYPLPDKVPKSLIFLTAISPIFMMLAFGYVSYTRQLVNPLLFQQSNSMPYFALFLSVSALIGIVVQPIFSKLSDLYGRKRIVLITAIPFALTVVVLGYAQNPVLFGAANFISGFFGASMTIMINGMIIDAYSPTTRTKLLGFTQSMSAFAGTVGPMLAGVVTDSTGVQTAMLIAAIIVGVAFVLLLVLFPDIKTQKRSVKIDFLGMLTLMLAVGPAISAISLGGSIIPWTSPLIYVLFIASVVFCFVFFRVEKNHDEPIVHMGFFKSKSFLVILLYNGLFGAAAALGTNYFNLYAFQVMGYTAAQVGTLSIMVWIPVVIYPLIGMFLAKTGKFRFVFMFGLGCNIAMCIIYYLVLTPTTPVWLAAISKIPQFIATCCTIMPVNAYLGAILPADKRGVGLGLSAFAQVFMVSVFTAVFGAILNAANMDIGIAFKTMLFVVLGVTLVRIFITVFVKKTADAKQDLEALNM